MAWVGGGAAGAGTSSPIKTWAPRTALTHRQRELLPSGAWCSRGTRATGSTPHRVWLSPLLCRERRAGGSGSAGGDSPRHRQGSAGPRVLLGCKRQEGRAEGKRKSHGTVAAFRLWLPAREGTLSASAPSGSPVMEETGAAFGAASLLPLLHAALALATPAQPAPRSASTLQHRGGRDSDAGTRLRRRYSPMPRSGMTRHVVAPRQGRCGGAAVADGRSCPPVQPRAPTGAVGTR